MGQDVIRVQASSCVYVQVKKMIASCPCTISVRIYATKSRDRMHTCKCNQSLMLSKIRFDVSAIFYSEMRVVHGTYAYGIPSCARYWWVRSGMAMDLP